jgi:hypothetical protein
MRRTREYEEIPQEEKVAMANFEIGSDHHIKVTIKATA